MAGKWPKRLPELTDEQRRIRDEFMKLWHEELPRKYGVVEWFNHGYPVWRRQHRRSGTRTLEIGPGLGEHLEYEDLEDQEYHAVELREPMAARLRERFPGCQAVVGDCQTRLPYPDGHFHRVLAIHVLEHLPNLPAALTEIRRVLAPGGQFCVVIPCEGGRLYSFCRNISARRLFERTYKMSYDWLYQSEHINVPAEIEDELARHFAVSHRRYFPLLVPLVDANVCIGLTLSAREDTGGGRGPAAGPTRLLRSMIERVLAVPLFFELQQRFCNTYQEVRAEFDEHLSPGGLDILDVGCSTGTCSGQIIDLERNRLLGVDIEPAYVARAAAVYPGGNWIAMDARNMGLRDSSIDVAMFVGVLHHMSDDLIRDCVRDIRRVLRPGGVMLVAEPVFTPGKWLSNALLHLDRGKYIRDADGYLDLLEGFTVERAGFFGLSVHRFCSYVLRREPEP